MTAAQPVLRILGIPGTVSAKAYNRYLMQAAQELAPDSVELEIFDLAQVPIYNADLLDLPPGVLALKNAIERSDALLFSTPEYNHSMPGVLKNAIDWASWPAVDSPLYYKTAAIMGATVGLWGTVRAQDHLRQVLSAARVHVVLRPEVFVSRAQEKFSPDGKLIDETTRSFVRALLGSLVEWTLRLREEEQAR